MVEEMKLSLVIGLLIFGGMSFGGVIIQMMFLLFNKTTNYLQIFCGGLLAGLFIFELIPDTFMHFTTLGIVTGISIGILLMISLEFFLHSHSNLRHKHQETFFLLMMALIIHSLPTGLTFGMTLQSIQLINYGLLLALILHHIPEGMVLMSSIPAIKQKNALFISCCLVLSLVISINLFIGMNMAMESIKWNTIMMGMTLGTLGYVTFYEVLWKKSRSLPKGKVGLTVLLGIVAIYYFFRFVPSHH